MATIVCGYDVRQIRGSQELALIIHLLDSVEMKVTTAIRIVSEDPSEIARYLERHKARFGERVSLIGNRDIKLNIRGCESTGRIAGHSVTVDRWFGLRAWAWLDMASDQGNVNVPVLTHTLPFEEMERAEGEAEEAMLSAYIAETMNNLQEIHPLRSVWQVKMSANGRYYFTAEPATEPQMDTARS
jgi:hypothetical protein